MTTRTIAATRARWARARERNRLLVLGMVWADARKPSLPALVEESWRVNEKLRVAPPLVDVQNFENVRDANTGHGHVRPRPDGMLARCGGPGLCRVCQAEAQALRCAPWFDPAQATHPTKTE